MSILVRFLLSLSFILLNGLGYTYAHTTKFIPNHSSHFTAATLNALQQHETLTIRCATGETQGDRGVKDDAPDSEDEEDEEPVPFKKHTPSSNYFTSFFGSSAIDYNSPFDNYAAFCQHFPFSACGKYIAYRVIRI